MHENELVTYVYHNMVLQLKQLMLVRLFFSQVVIHTRACMYVCVCVCMYVCIFAVTGIFQAHKKGRTYHHLTQQPFLISENSRKAKMANITGTITPIKCHDI
jgi:uncharacterized membrane protein (DUF4010 family)